MAGAAAFVAANPRARHAARTGWSLLDRGGSTRGELGPTRLVLIHDETSPTTYVFDMNVPDGGRTVVNPDGSATVYDADGNPVQHVQRPWAFDSAGRPQQTWYTVDKNLVQHVQPADNALYPILADPTVAGAGTFREADEASLAAYDAMSASSVPQGAGDWRAAEEASMAAADTTSVPQGAGDWRAAEEQSMVAAEQLEASTQPVSDARLPDGVVAVPGETVSWTDGNGSERTFTQNEFGQKVWTTTQADGTVITVTEGGGSDGADKPWKRTEITHPDGTSSRDYDSDGVTGYVYTDEYGVQHRITQYPDGDIAEQTFQGGEEGSRPPTSTTTRWGENGSVFITQKASDGSIESQYDYIPDPYGGYTERIVNADGTETLYELSGGSDGADQPTASGYTIDLDGQRTDFETGPDGTTTLVTHRDGARRVVTLYPDGSALSSWIDDSEGLRKTSGSMRWNADGSFAGGSVSGGGQTAEVREPPTLEEQIEGLMWIIPLPGVGIVGKIATKIPGVKQVISRAGAEAVARSGAQAATNAATPVSAQAITIERIYANPQVLAGKSPAEVAPLLQNSPGWRVETLGRGQHAGQGWVLRHYNPSGNPTGPQIRWHPGGGHHGPNPYWRVVGPNGKIGGLIDG